MIGDRLRLARPHFLVGGVLLCLLGSTWGGTLDVGRYLATQVMVTAIQLAAQLANEWADVAADRLVTSRTWFSGGSGVLDSDTLPRGVALRGALISSAVAVFAIGIVATASVVAAAIGVVALTFSWAYSVPPRLLGSGLGELGASLVVAGGVPVAGSLTQLGGVPSGLWWAVAVLVLAHLGMIIAFELPDVASDAAAGKRVLAVRVGPPAGRWLVAAAWTLALGVGVGAVVADQVDSVALWGGVAAVVLGIASWLAAGRGRWGWSTTTAVLVLVAWIGGFMFQSGAIRSVL